jgi:hypothetical protein
VRIAWEYGHCQLVVSLSVLVRATFAEVPTSGHSEASYVSSMSGCVCTQKLVHFTEYLLFALPQTSDADFYHWNSPLPPLHPSIRASFCTVHTVTTSVTLDVHAYCNCYA